MYRLSFGHVLCVDFLRFDRVRCTFKYSLCFIFFFQAADGIRGYKVTGVQTCALPISELIPVLTEKTDNGESSEIEVRHADAKSLPIKDIQAGQSVRIHLDKAKKIIKYVSFYLITLFTIENFIIKNSNNDAFMLIVGTQFHIVILLYILGHIGLAFGCYHLARAEGRSGEWGLLGLASLPGLSILLLLPTMQQGKPSKLEPKTVLFSITMLAISAFWFIDTSGDTIEYSRFLEQSVHLRAQRHEYPSKVFDTDPGLYSGEIDELEVLLHRGFQLIEQGGYSSKDVQDIANTMFAETMRVFVWINYQKYLQYRNGQIVPDIFKQQNIVALQRKIFVIINQKISTITSSTLRTVFREWFLGHFVGKVGYEFLRKFSHDLFEMKSNLMNLDITAPDILTPPQFSFANVTLPPFRNLKTPAIEDVSTLLLSQHPL